MMSYRSTIVLLIFSFLTVFAACSSEGKKEQKGGGKANRVSAEVYVLKPEAFQQDYSASGTLLPNEEVEIHPEITGRITNILFKEGTYVRKGQTLVTLFDADILAQLQKLKAQKALQQKLQERQKELVDIGGISRQDFEATQTGIATIDADIAAQEAALRRTKIIAPFDGIVGIRSISVGAIVSPATTIAVLQQVHPLKVDFSIPEQYHSLLKSGMPVAFTVAGIQGNRTGTISSIDPGADMATRTIKVRAIVPNPNRELLAGAFAEVKIPFESSPEALLIPTQAVIPTTRDKKVVILRNGKAEMTTVKLGTRLEDKVEILEGLKSGDTVLTTGLMQVKPGMDVQVVKVNG